MLIRVIKENFLRNLERKFWPMQMTTLGLEKTVSSENYISFLMNESINSVRNSVKHSDDHCLARPQTHVLPLIKKWQKVKEPWKIVEREHAESWYLGNIIWYIQGITDHFGLGWVEFKKLISGQLNRMGEWMIANIHILWLLKHYLIISN